MSIAANLEKIKKEIPAHVTLVAVSKKQPLSSVEEAFQAGQLHFGENQVQEMTAKQALLSPAVRWHQIGHLQSNKIKYLIPYVFLIHSVDSFRLLSEIHRQAKKNGRCISVLLQVHIAKEETKFGLAEKELAALMEQPELEQFDGIKISGLMGMATNTTDTVQIGKEFSGLSKLFHRFSAAYNNHPVCRWEHLSMGMSGDYKIALEEGSTMLRIGSSIFGKMQAG
jgi:pyridoxal phosphate enzyme (YggS family)